MSRTKKKKEIMPWRKGILDHHKSRPSAADRGEFPAKVVEMAKRSSRGLCQFCFKNKCETTHHVMPRGRGGRGVFENAFRCCGTCHIKIEGSEELKQKLIEQHKQKFGDFFWYDEIDWTQKKIEEEEYKW